jgi:ketosteroid isomerase-like protein
MSQQSVAIAREIHARFNARESTDELIADHLEYVNPPDAIEGGTARWPEALSNLLDIYPDLHVEVERIVDSGEDVLVVATARGTSATGVTVERRQGYVWTIRGGHAVRFRWFSEPSQALAAIGLAE